MSEGATGVTPPRVLDLIARIQTAYVPLRDGIGAQPSGAFDRPLAAGWTLKEMAAHLAYWEGTVAPYLDALRSGRREAPSGTVDEQNARAAEGARTRSGSQVMEEWDAIHAELIEAVRGLTDAEAADESVIGKIAGDTYDHYPEHYAELTTETGR